MIDIHAHILPGIDDGPADLDISLELCMSAYNRGVDIIIATPHYWHAVYQPLRHEVMEKIDLLTNELKKRKILIKVLPGMEVYLDVELPNWLKSKKIYTCSLIGLFGKSSEQAAKLFLRCNWVDFIASDCHGKQRPYIFTE